MTRLLRRIYMVLLSKLMKNCNYKGILGIHKIPSSYKVKVDRSKCILGVRKIKI